MVVGRCVTVGGEIVSAYAKGFILDINGLALVPVIAVLQWVDISKRRNHSLS
jgi:hypothetical protein